MQQPSLLDTTSTGRNLAVGRYGYKGFYNRKQKPVVLNSKAVEGIQLQGGTILGTSRGGADIK